MAQPVTKTKREPPPTLFLHPSPAASHVSLPGISATGGSGSSNAAANGTTTQTQASLQRSTSILRHEVGGSSSLAADNRRPAHRTSGVGLGGGFSVPSQFRQETTRATDRTDALWAEMQATLEEVELSASGGTRVFGPDHDQKLAELRQAQIALAQAWSRSEADEAMGATLSTEATVRNAKAAAGGGKDGHGIGSDTAGKADVGSTTATSARPGSSGIGTGAERLGAKLEEETEVDILLARKRREANDRYFQRVNEGVLDVVTKLEDVAVAMRAVEQESKDIWQENESVSDAGKAGDE